MMGDRTVFDYSDYRQLLRDFYWERKKSRAHAWSLGIWARQLGLKSPSTLAMILKGSRNPGPELTGKLAKTLRLGPKEIEYFEDLVTLKKHQDDPRLSVLIMEKLGKQHPSGQFQLLDADTFYLISNWYNYAIREMVNLRDFREDSKWISEQIHFKVTPKEVDEAIEALLRLNLLKRNERGRLVSSAGTLTTNNDIADEGIKRFHEQTLGNASEALRKIDPSRREIIGITFCMRESKLAEAKGILRKFRTEFGRLFESGDGDAVYHLELAFIPLTGK